VVRSMGSSVLRARLDGALRRLAGRAPGRE